MAASDNRNPALFIALSGSILRYVRSIPDLSRLLMPASALRGIVMLHHAGFRIIMICTSTRLPITADESIDLEREIRALFETAEIPLEGFYSCADLPTDSAAPNEFGCRAIQSAARDHAIDLERSWVVGELLDEMEAGRRAGCGTILIDNGSEPSWNLSHWRTPDLIVPDLQVAAESLVTNDEFL